jgi:hypothetical protein
VTKIAPENGTDDLVVKDNAQEGIVDVDRSDLAIVSDEPQFPEFGHEQIDPRPRYANHFRKHLLRYFGNHVFRMVLRTKAREQQQSARQPFFAGIEELVYQVSLDSYVSSQHKGDKRVGELMFPMKHPNHLVFVNEEHRRWCRRGRSRHANGLACKAPFPKKIVRSKDGHNAFFSALVDHTKFYAAFLNVNDMIRGIAL